MHGKVMLLTNTGHSDIRAILLTEGELEVLLGDDHGGQHLGADGGAVLDVNPAPCPADTL